MPAVEKLPKNQAADLLERLAANEFAAAQAWIERLEQPHHAIFLVEACRVVDYHHVLQFISRNPNHKVSDFDFDVMMRGWNPLLGMLLPHIRDMGGFPAMESTLKSREFILSALYSLGRAALARESARRIRHGMATGTVIGKIINLKMSERCDVDHFLDKLEEYNLEHLGKKWFGSDQYEEQIKASEIEDLDARIDALVFPWQPKPGITMVGYGAEPDIDQYYLALAIKGAVDGREDAGIHPDAQFGSINGGDLTLIVFMIMSAYLKHIRFVDRGKRKYPEVNYPMGLTIWGSKAELVQSITNYIDIPPATVAAAVDFMTVKSTHHQYFRDEPTSFVPMLIELSDNYLIKPVSSIFRNPLHGIRMLHELNNNAATAAIRAPREQWMAADLYALFMGNRYQCMLGPARLSRKGKVVTDIDAAVFDRVTGELALFQLKWQDMNSNDVVKQRSRAKNFVEKVDRWTTQTQTWITEFGQAALLQALRFSAAPARQPHVRLFAIGRSAARFRSYGYVPDNLSVAASSWRQFIRLRHEVGPADNVFRDLHAAIQTEQTKPVKRVPLRQEFRIDDCTIVLEDIWNSFDDAV